MFDALLQRCGKGFCAVLAGEVGDEGVAFAKSGKLGGGLVAGLGIAGADENARAGFEEALGDHPPNAAGTTSNQGGTALEAEIGMHEDASTMI
ncbi:hypothetical protein D3C77_546860 [compost metagenome]